MADAKLSDERLARFVDALANVGETRAQSGLKALTLTLRYKSPIRDARDCEDLLNAIHNLPHILAEVRALRPCEKALRDLRECTNPFLRFDEREVHRRCIAAQKALYAIDGSTGPMGGVWRCGCCGEMHADSTTDPSWRWAGDHWQHKCDSTSPQHGHEPARYFGRALEADRG